MKFIATRINAYMRGVILCVLPFLCAESQAEDMMTDPLLGLNYDPHVVKFEIYREHGRCPNKGVNWVFAKLSDEGHEYTITAKLVPVEGNPANGFESTSGLVTDYDVKAQICKQIGAPDIVFDPKEGKLSNRVKVALVKDAYVRYVSAFGSEGAFKSAVKTQRVDTSALPSVVSEGFGIK